MNNDDYQKYFDELKEYLQNIRQDQAELLLTIADLKIQNYSNINKIERQREAIHILLSIAHEHRPDLDLSSFKNLIK